MIKTELFITKHMSKYNNLWLYAAEKNAENLILTFDEIEKICGRPIDHSFLTYKKELLEYGYEVSKISMKNKTITIIKTRA